MEKGKQNDIIREFEVKKKDIIRLKNKMNSLNSEKEKWFNERKKLSLEIGKRIDIVRKIRNERDQLTNQVKSSKKRRSLYNRWVKDKIGAIKNLKIGKIKIKRAPKERKPETSQQLKEKIERAEFKIETEPMSFEKEKVIMADIKEMKKKVSEMEKHRKIKTESRNISKDIDELRKKAEDAHGLVKNVAEASQEKHEKAIKISKEIDELREKESKALQKFVEMKGEYTKVQNSLAKLLMEVNELSKKVGIVKDKQKKTQKHKLKVKAPIKIKRKSKLRKIDGKEIEDKLKKGKKLTTEDLLAYQVSQS